MYSVLVSIILIVLTGVFSSMAIVMLLAWLRDNNKDEDK